MTEPPITLTDIATLAALANGIIPADAREAGARKVRIGLNYGAHAMGSGRMGADAKISVFNEFCECHDVKNLFLCDTSVFVTGSGVNPTLTAMAIADRAAEHLIECARRGEL
jgi:choline dehydrogenase-like flavoprotein